LRTSEVANNAYDEYIYVNGGWELLGSSQVDLTGYATESWVNLTLKDYVKEVNLQSKITAALNTALSDGTFKQIDDPTIWYTSQRATAYGGENAYYLLGIHRSDKARTPQVDDLVLDVNGDLYYIKTVYEPVSVDYEYDLIHLTNIKGNATTYVLKKGETVNKAPSSAQVVYDPYTNDLVYDAGVFAQKEGWSPNKILGTNAQGAIIEKDTDFFNQLTLGYGEDGKVYLYFNKQPIGTGISVSSSTSVDGTINQDNNIIFSNSLANGAYTMRFLSGANVYSEEMYVDVSDFVSDDESLNGNIIPTLLDTDLVNIYNNVGYKEYVRISVTTGGEISGSEIAVLLTGLIPVGSDGDVFHIRGISSIVSTNPNYGGYWCYGLDGKLLNTKSGIPAIPTSCIGADENGDYTITMRHSDFTLLEGTAYIRFQLGLTSGNVIMMTRNELIQGGNGNSGITEGLGENLLTSGTYTVHVDQRYSGSAFSYVDCAGMVSLIVPIDLVLNRRIRVSGFTYGIKTPTSQPLWFTLNSSNVNIGYIIGTDSNTGIWGTDNLVQESDGTWTFLVNSNTTYVAGATQFVINLAVNNTGKPIAAVPDGLSLTVEEIA
jgi:hypothetical protein